MLWVARITSIDLLLSRLRPYSGRMRFNSGLPWKPSIKNTFLPDFKVTDEEKALQRNNFNLALRLGVTSALAQDELNK